MTEIHEIPVSNIALDDRNPREGQTDQTQKQKLQLYAADPKISRLATHLVENGVNPSEQIIVMADPRHDSKYIVLEGNRRVAARKLLLKPEVIDNEPLRRRFKKIAADIVDTSWLKIVPTIVVGDREEADVWIKLRHGGEQEGAGRVDWGPSEAARYDELMNRPNRDVNSNRLVDYLEGEGAIDEETADLVRGKLTTLTRLLSNRHVVEVLGLMEGPNELSTRSPVRQFKKITKQIVSDIAEGNQNSRTLNNAAAVNSYIDRTVADTKFDSSKQTRVPTVVATTSSPKPAKKKRNKKKTPSKFIIDGSFSPAIENTRISQIVTELKTLDVDSHPNACAVMLRVMLDLVVHHYLSFHKISFKPGDKLAKKVNLVCDDLLGSKQINSQALKPIKLMVGTQDSVWSMYALHEFVHNQFMTPGPSDLRTAWEKMRVFLETSLNESSS